MLVTADTHPDAKCIFNGDDISGICSAADVEEGWAEVVISIPEKQKAHGINRVHCIKASDDKDVGPMKVKIYGKVEIAKRE